MSNESERTKLSTQATTSHIISPLPEYIRQCSPWHIESCCCTSVNSRHTWPTANSRCCTSQTCASSTWPRYSRRVHRNRNIVSITEAWEQWLKSYDTISVELRMYSRVQSSLTEQVVIRLCTITPRQRARNHNVKYLHAMLTVTKHIYTRTIDGGKCFCITRSLWYD